MTADLDQNPRSSPLLSAWLRPRDTISQIIAHDPGRHVLILAALGGIATVVATIVSLGIGIVHVEWPVAAGILLLGALDGLLAVYLGAAVLRWICRLFGGRASAVELRAVLAWSTLPIIIALVVAIGVLAWLAYSPGTVPAAPVFTALAVITAILNFWSLVMILLMLARVQHFGFWRTVGSYAVYSIAAGAGAALFIRIFLFQPFNIPSGAEMPTLLIGDYLFVSKYAYGYTRYSLPFSPPLFRGRIFGAEPQRGDTVVFRLPKDDSTDYIKRVVGLPGERIQMRGGELYINGVAVKRERIADYIDQSDGRTVRVKRWRETLPNGVSYETLDLQDNGFLDNTQEYTVPPGHYFMMGDNRDNSTDSRVLTQVGYIPLENIIGRATMLFFSIDESGRTRSERIGAFVR